MITKIPVIRATPVLPRARAINIPRKGYRGRIWRIREFHWTRWDIFAIMHLEFFTRKYAVDNWNFLYPMDIRIYDLYRSCMICVTLIVVRATRK